MRRMVAPTVHFTVVRRPLVLRRANLDHSGFVRPRVKGTHPDYENCDSNFEPQESSEPASPVADLLPWADPYIAMLAARLEAQGRLENASR